MMGKKGLQGDRTEARSLNFEACFKRRAKRYDRNHDSKVEKAKRAGEGKEALSLPADTFKRKSRGVTGRAKYRKKKRGGHDRLAEEERERRTGSSTLQQREMGNYKAGGGGRRQRKRRGYIRISK